MSRSLKVAVVVSIATVALLYGAIEHGRRIREQEPLHELPSTARAVLRIDTGSLRHTPAAAALFHALGPEEQLTEIEATCGIAPLDALSDIVLWVRGPDDQPFQSIGLMLTGRTADATALAECHRSLVEDRGGSVVRLDGPTGSLLTSRDRRSAIALLDQRTIVTGSVRTVAETLEVARGSAPALVVRAPIAELWRRISRDAAVSTVLEPPEHWREALQNLDSRGQDRPALEGIRMIGLRIRSGSERMIEVELYFVEPDTARRSAAQIEGWLRNPPDSVEPPWIDVLTTATVKAEGQTISISLDVSALAKTR